MDNVNRESATSKLTEFSNEIPSLIEFLRNNINLYKKKLVKKLLDNTRIFKSFSFFLVVIANMANIYLIKHKFCNDGEEANLDKC